MFCRLCRIGNTPELRFTPAGKAVLNLSLAYSYGRKGEDGKKPTQWIDASLWDKQAEGLAPHLKKGNQVSVALDDLHIEEFEGKNGKGYKLVGRVVSLDFADSKDSKEESAFVPASKPAAKSGGFDNFDEIPFN
jgi:single-strand DNA-binding protein